MAKPIATTRVETATKLIISIGSISILVLIFRCNVISNYQYKKSHNYSIINFPILKFSVINELTATVVKRYLVRSKKTLPTAFRLSLFKAILFNALLLFNYLIFIRIIQNMLLSFYRHFLKFCTRYLFRLILVFIK